MARTDSSLAALLLVQRLVDADVPPLKASEYWALLDQVGDPAVLLGADAATVAQAAEVDQDLAERIVRLLDAASAFAFELDEAEQTGMHVVSPLDDGYPSALTERLGRGAPPVLYAVGDLALLGREMLGIVGARDVGETAAEVAKAAAAEAVRLGLGVVSGGAKGVDRLAMTAALDAEGTAVGVLADSLTRTTRDPDVRRMVGDGRLCLSTPYKPTAPFSVPNAMGRNKLIYALSTATLVVTADAEKGGTWAGATEALRHRFAPVLAWSAEGAGPGNPLLLQRGATGLASVEELPARLHSPPVPTSSGSPDPAGAPEATPPADPGHPDQLSLGI